MKRWTVDDLRALDACAEQVEDLPMFAAPSVAVETSEGAAERALGSVPSRDAARVRGSARTRGRGDARRMNAYRGKSRRGYIYVRATGKRKLRACGEGLHATLRITDTGQRELGEAA